jgi:hypothetical protein
VLENIDGFDELAIHVGFAPIQIVAAAALDALGQKDLLGENLFMGIMGLIANISEFLVKNGARLSLDQPPAVRSPFRSSSSMNDLSTGSEEGNEDVNPVERARLKIQSNKQLGELLGVFRLNSAQMVWNSVKSRSSSANFIFHTDKLAIEDSEAPGGSDEKSCAICWKSFGTLMNRKHRCRISRRYVCDECSSKRVTENGEEHRVIDGQFLLAKADEAREESRKLEASKKTERLAQDGSTTAARLDRLEAEERAKRDSLFGGVIENMAKAVFGGDAEETEESQASSIQGLSAKLNQTRDALNERGEKLNTLSEKSEKLVNASQDFASMAKELNRESQNKWF